MPDASEEMLLKSVLEIKSATASECREGLKHAGPGMAGLYVSLSCSGNRWSLGISPHYLKTAAWVGGALFCHLAAEPFNKWSKVHRMC